MIRSLKTMVAPWVLVTILSLLMTFSRTGWQSDLGWAINWAHGSTILMAPAASGIAALAIVRSYSTSFQSLTITTVRGSATPLLIVLRSWLIVVMGWATCIGISIVVALLSGATPRIPPTATALVTGPPIFAAASSVGMLSALLLRSIASAPLAAGFTYAVALGTSRMPMARIMWDGGATASIASLTLEPTIVAGTVIVNLAISGCLLSVSWMVVRRSVTVGPLLSLGSFVGTVTICISATFGTQYYQQPQTAVNCSNSKPVVCSPATNALDPGRASESLRIAISRLSGAGFEDFPSHFSIDPPDNRPEAAPLITTGRTDDLLSEEVTLSLVSPKPTCSLPKTDAVVGAVSDLRNWVNMALQSSDIDTDDPATRWARTTYNSLRNCLSDELTPREDKG